MKKLFALAIAPFVAACLVGCDVDMEDEGKLPDVDVEGGRLPDVDVRTPDVDVEMKETEVKVPDVDVNIPEENEE